MNYSTIAETQNYIVLDDYTKLSKVSEAPTTYQSEHALEREFIEDLIAQGYEYLPQLTTPAALLANVRTQLQTLNQVTFTDEEWKRFCEEYLDRASDSLVDKSRKIHDNYIYDFVFDDGHIQNIYLVDKKVIARNKVQVINQFEQTGSHANRYDVTILVNGLPLVQIELKKRGVAIREAFNQVHRYSKESFNSESSLYKYLQLFVISNGTDTRYFANTIKREKNNFDFTMHWAKANNELIRDLKDFTATFFQKNTLLQVVLTYSVLDISNTLLVMRPYQIAATERLLWKIRSAHETKKWSATEGFGYIWHTTGSGKTLTSFKAARLATELDFVDKVFFVVDRKDLDYQTMKEYQRFSPDSVNGSSNTKGLKENLEKKDNKIIVTTIQKLNNLIKSENNLPVYGQQVVFIFDEAHRSQFGEAQKNIKKKFKYYYQFGFTGTPIFTENALGAETTASVFGSQLHTYIITDAIRDEKVLKFKVDYNDVRPKFSSLENEQNEEKLSSAEYKQLMMHPQRIQEVSQYILQNFRLKTHRGVGGNKGFNAMLAVSSVEAAKSYYQQLNLLQKDSPHPLKIATIFSYAANEEQQAKGEIEEESFEPSAMELTAKEFLSKVVEDYNTTFKTNFSLEGKRFELYYKDLSARTKNQEIDLLIVVGMFLTGFDAPRLNTLFVDKNLSYHGLIQAYSRTNRIYNDSKRFGNIVTFRNLEEETIKAIKLFGKEKTKDVILEKSYQEYLDGFDDILSGKKRRGYKEVVSLLKEQFPDPEEITTKADKKAFVKLFGEYLQIENILQNYDEFTSLRDFQAIDKQDPEAVEAFRQAHFLTPEQVATMQQVELLSERTLQDYRSTYNDIRDWFSRERESEQGQTLLVDWEDVVFEVELLKSQEINLDYILELIFDGKEKDKDSLAEDIRRLIRTSIGNRAKESLLVDFIYQANFSTIEDKPAIIAAFFTYAQERQREEAADLIAQEDLKPEAAMRYIQASLHKGYPSENGTDLTEILPKMSPLNPQYLSKKQTVFQKIAAFVEKYKGI